MTLHGVYDNGKITLTDKDLPKVKTDVEVILHEKQEIAEAFGMWKDRDEMKDSTEYVQKMRKKSSLRAHHEPR